ncbi:MAG: DUF624 domain-containing protein [Lachnospiraceae bacterium]|jgi:uncharacterized membrane protein YesL|nr:DUF624 domain-containing protein [Lachnospiraceae bacterium]
MGRFLSLDSPTMVFLTRVADLMLLNIIVLFFCLPIITIGPAICAMHYVLLKMVRGEEGYLLKPFMKSFKYNFKKAMIAWVIILVFIIIFAVDLQIINNSGLEFAYWLRVALLAVGVIATMVLLYVFPLLARFENTVRATFKNALYISILHLPKTILMFIVCVAPILIVVFNLGLLPLLILLGISGPGYICALLYSKTFKRFEPEEEAEIDADSWTVSLEDEVKESLS